MSYIDLDEYIILKEMGELNEINLEFEKQLEEKEGKRIKEVYNDAINSLCSFGLNKIPKISNETILNTANKIVERIGRKEKVFFSLGTISNKKLKAIEEKTKKILSLETVQNIFEKNVVSNIFEKIEGNNFAAASEETRTSDFNEIKFEDYEIGFSMEDKTIVVYIKKNNNKYNGKCGFIFMVEGKEYKYEIEIKNGKAILGESKENKIEVKQKVEVKFFIE